MFPLKGQALLALFFLCILPHLHSQSQANPAEPDPVSLVGLTIEELLRSFGTPRSVHAARGLEEWQDDVVFVYEQGDFYVYRDRVWQVGLRELRGINTGDSRGVVSLVLGSGAETRGASIFYPINDRSWPLMLRYDFDSAGRVQAIFIYRTDL